MNRILKAAQSLLLSGVILISSQHKAEAFFPIPPLPPSFEVNIPGNVTKVISNIKTIYKKLQTIASEINSIDLEAIKGCITGGSGCEELERVAGMAAQYRDQINMRRKSKGEAENPAAPGKGKIKENEDLGIAEGDINEFNYYNAYHKLFFTYPSPESVASAVGQDVDIAVIQAAYKSRAAEYKQDIIVDTYLAGKLTESYLDLVEKTIDRMDLCQKGIKEGKDCIFFGIEMQKVDATEEGQEPPEKPDPDAPSAGQVGAAKNAYIVTMVYDRLMRIVEDLTATEAIYRAAKQIDLGKPVNESSAEKYIEKKYHFAYTDSKENTYAAGLLSKAIRLSKDGKEGLCQKAGKKGIKIKGCPGYNAASASIVNMDNTEILEKLQPVDEILNKAIMLHNFKVQLPDYKTQYRKYLKATEIHKKALEALKQSDSCVVEFLKTYGTDKTANWKNRWDGGISSPSDHEHRLGISRDLIEEYQESINETIVGSTSACPNYYETCPDGYYLDKSESCEDNGVVLYPCSIEMVEGDTGDEAEPEGASIDDIANGAVDQTVDNSSYNDADGLLDASGADKIDQSNRLRAEETWQIGSKKMIELAKNGTLSFDAWNDQQQLQGEYLRNKYRNIKLIVQSIDQGIGAYKIAAELAGSASSASSSEEEEIINSINSYVSAISQCMSISDAKAAAKEEFCKGTASERNCTISDNGHGIIKGKKEVYKGYDYARKKAIWEEQEKTWNQVISLNQENKCAFARTPQTFTGGSTSEYCNGTWDLTIGFLVKNYLPKTFGGCKSSRQDQAKYFYTDALSKGRIVAQTKLDNVLETRNKEETRMRNLIQEYEKKQESAKTNLQNIKNKISGINNSINTASKTKNTAQKELNRAIKRIKAIKDEEEKSGEWYDLEEKKAKAKELAALDNQGESVNSYECTVEKQQLALEFEKGAIEGKAEKELLAAWKCPKACELAAKESSRSIVQRTLKKEMLCKKNLRVSDYKVSLAAKLRTNNPDKNEDHYVSPDEAKERIKTESDKIKRLKSTRDSYKGKIAIYEEELQKNADKFAEDYIDMAESNQGNIEESNTAFESFLEKLEDDNKRMEDSKNEICLKKNILGICKKYASKPYASENLSATIIGIYHKKDLGEDEESIRSQIKEIVKNDMNNIWWNDSTIGAVVNQLSSLGIPAKFFTDGEVDVPVLGKLSTVSSAAEVAQKIKDMIIEIAANKVTDHIMNADKIMKEEVEQATKKVENFAKRWDICTDCANPSSRLSELMNRTYYQKDGKFITDHQKLINQLRTPKTANKTYLKNAGMELSELLGIPEDGEALVVGEINSDGKVVKNKKIIGVADKTKGYAYSGDGSILGEIKSNKVINTVKTPDDEYFVGLPARGTISSLGQKRYTISKEACVNDCSAGRDYKAPKEPLLNLPPVREVFYFSSLDYQEVPKDKRRKDNYYLPSISELLNLKYPNDSAHKWEYLPEIWRYLLARPNLRNDGKYQQTFVERSLQGANLNNLLENLDNKNIVDAKGSDYYAITARAGVYPCWTKNSGRKVIIDIDGGPNVGDMQFKYREAAPTDIEKIGECKEVAYNSAINTTCYTYNYEGKSSKDRQSGICHLMADHGENKDVQNKLGLTKNPMYSKHSELGQFLTGDLRYRPLQQNIQEYFLNEDNTANNIDRQKAERASFKRNLFGSFLETVNSEYTAKKNVVSMEEEIMKTLKNLCKQIHENGETASGQEGETEEACATYIKSNGGLASYAEDRVYGEEGEYSDKAQAYKGVNCKLTKQPNYYNDLYCKLHEWKNKKLAEAKSQYTQITKKFTTQEKNRVKERLEEIENTIQILTKDNKEVVQVTPNLKLSELEGKLKNAKADRTAARKTDDDGIVSMDNQGQVIPYCPAYRFKYK